MKKYKICLIAHLNDLSGANKALIDLACGLKDIYDVTVVVPRKGALMNELTKNGLKVKVILSGTWVYKVDEAIIKRVTKRVLNFFGEYHYYRFYKKEKFDLIHYNSITYGCGARAAKLLNIPYIWHIRELAEENFRLSFFNRERSLQLINESDRIVTISNFMLNKVKLLFEKKDIKVIYDGKKIKAKPQYHAVEGYKLALIGAIAEDKGQIDAVRALDHLNKKGRVLDLYLVGAVTDTQYHKKLLEEITPNIRNHVIFSGYQNDVREYRGSEYIALMCSKAEAFGLVTVEAMNDGQLIIGANGGATSEIIQDGICGYLYTPGNYVELAQKIELLMASTDKKQFVENAYRNINERFNISQTIKNVDELYQELLDNG